MIRNSFGDRGGLCWPRPTSRSSVRYPFYASVVGENESDPGEIELKVLYGMLGAIGAAGFLFSLLVLWITMTPTSDEFYERNMRIAEALDEARIKALKAERDRKIEELDTAGMLEIERDTLRDSIVRDFKHTVGSRTRARDAARQKNTEDRQRKLALAGLGLLVSLLITVYSIWRFRVEKNVDCD